MGNCNTCPLYVAAEKFAMTSTPRSARPSRSIWNDDTFTPFGRLVAAAAMTARLKTRQDLSSLLGYSRSNSNFGDVMRGKSGVSGPVLSSLWSFCTSNGYTHSYNDFAGAYRSSLLPIEKKTGRTRRSSTANQSDAGQLPFQPGPCAVDARTAS